MEGGKHHINFIVLYYSEDIGKCVEKFILAKTTVNETALIVANCFLDWCKENKVKIEEKLIMVNSDHAATMRGSKTSAVTRISDKAPSVSTCDIGGDFLHDLTNSTKTPFYSTFPNVIKLLDITRQDFNKSGQKEAEFLKVCLEQGLATTKPQVWARSRFLSRFAGVQERRKRIHNTSLGRTLSRECLKKEERGDRLSISLGRTLSKECLKMRSCLLAVKRKIMKQATENLKEKS